MPMMVLMKVVIMCPWRTVSCGSGMVHDNTDFCACPVAVPTTMGDAFSLRFPQGKLVVMKIPLAPASDIAVLLG